ncbi:MAG: AAA family ATPase [Candidatus Competibacteraceae bacterium]|nr:AAA family ATPase [Candidatus Competibacteraceae bacterium]
MLSDVMNYFNLRNEFDQAGYYDTENHRYLSQEMTAAIKKGRIIALTGIVGCGKTKLLQQWRRALKQENAVMVARSLAVDKTRVNLAVLMRAIAYALATDDKAVNLPKQPEDREHRVIELIAKHKKPTVLFCDDAHDLHASTLAGLKRLTEIVRDEGEMLSIVLAGHPKLKNDLRRPTLEEIGARTEIFTLEGIQGQSREYLVWLLAQCTAGQVKSETIITDEALDVLTERLVTPLQLGHYLTRALEEAFQIGQKPVTAEIVNSVLAIRLNDPEPHLIRHGYPVRSLAQLINVKPTEIRAFLGGQLPPGRSQELKDQLLKDGVPL